MKKILILLILAITAIGYIACKKPKPAPDYRDKWVGKYDGEYTTSFQASSHTQIVVINVDIWGDSSLLIKCNKELRNTKENYDVCVKNDGSFFDYDIYSKISGHFF